MKEESAALASCLGSKHRLEAGATYCTYPLGGQFDSLGLLFWVTTEALAKPKYPSRVILSGGKNLLGTIR